MFQDQPLNDTGCEQHRVNIISQRRRVMAVAIDRLDRIADLKSVECHVI